MHDQISSRTNVTRLWRAVWLRLCWVDQSTQFMLAGCLLMEKRQLVRHGQTASDLAYRLPDNNFYTCRVVVYQIRSLHGVYKRFWVGTRGPTTGTDIPLTMY